MSRFIFLVFLLLIPIHIFAETMECPKLKIDNSIELELKSSESFANCFSLANVPSETTVRFVLWSVDSVSSKVKLYELTSSGSLSYVSEHTTNTKGGIAFQSNTTDKNLVFVIEPLTHLSSNKNLAVSYLYFDNIAQIIANIDDMPLDDTTTPPPEAGGGCYYINGTRVCENAK